MDRVAFQSHVLAMSGDSYRIKNDVVVIQKRTSLSGPIFNCIVDHFSLDINNLKLKSAYTYLMELHINNGISSSELKGLYKVLNKVVLAKKENNKLYNVKAAGFPFLRTIDEYDFSFQPTVDESKVKVVRIFPNQKVALRLIVSVLIDINDEWNSSGRIYINYSEETRNWVK